MKYLDERIIFTVNNLQIAEDGVFRYDVMLEGDLQFIGNCFIGKGSTSKSIDATDIVRGYYTSIEEVNLTNEWQVIITVNNVKHYSDLIGIYPIYRYPNRKKDKSLEGDAVIFLQDDFVPHIPLEYSDNAHYGIKIKTENNPNVYLYTGVKKDILQKNNTITNSDYTLKDLLCEKGDSLDWNLNNLDNTFIGDNVAKDPFKVWTDAEINKGELEPIKSSVKMQSAFPLVFTGEIGHTPRQITLNGKTENITEMPCKVNLTSESSSVNLMIDNVQLTPELNTLSEINAEISLTPNFKTFIDLIDSGPGTKTEHAYGIGYMTEFVKLDIIDVNLNRTTINAYDGQMIFIPDRVKMINLTGEDGTNIGTLYLSSLCFANNGFEYGFLFNLQQNVLIYPVIVDYHFEAKLTAKRLISNPQDIYLRNDGTDSLTNSDVISVNGNNTLYNIIEGNPNVQMNGGLAFNIEQYSIIQCTVVGPDNQIIKQFVVGGGIHNFPLVEGDVEFYISEIRKDGTYNIIKVNSKGLGLVKGISVYRTNNLCRVEKYVAVNSNNPKYQKYFDSRINILAGKIDICPSRYYLQWRDRYGSMQMQPFSKTETYSEDFTRSEVKNYYDTRRLANIKIQPKWKLNSAWIPFEEVYYYESLFISPWIKLVDTKEDVVYDVILKGNNFIEKTYRNNDLKLWNLQVEVEQTNVQNILW